MILMPKLMIPDIYGLTDEFLDAHGIRGIIFDIDNTLVGFRTAEPTAENLRLFAHLKERGIPFAIASNNNGERVGRFAKDLGVPYRHRACKPLGFALLRLCKEMGVSRCEVALVGDQIYTDMLGGNLLGMITVLVDPIDLKETTLFKIKRALEKPVVERRRRMEEKK